MDFGLNRRYNSFVNTQRNIYKYLTLKCKCEVTCVFCRKYLRDVDRTQLSQLAFVYCLDALDERTREQSSPAVEGGCHINESDKLNRLLLTYQVRQYAAKMQASYSPRADQLLMSAYHVYIGIKVFVLFFHLFIVSVISLGRIHCSIFVLSTHYCCCCCCCCCYCTLSLLYFKIYLSIWLSSHKCVINSVFSVSEVTIKKLK